MNDTPVSKELTKKLIFFLYDRKILLDKGDMKGVDSLDDSFLRSLTVYTEQQKLEAKRNQVTKFHSWVVSKSNKSISRSDLYEWVDNELTTLNPSQKEATS